MQKFKEADLIGSDFLYYSIEISLKDGKLYTSIIYKENIYGLKYKKENGIIGIDILIAFGITILGSLS